MLSDPIDGDQLALLGPGAVKIYLDPLLRSFSDESEVEWDRVMERFWLRHPELNR